MKKLMTIGFAALLLAGCQTSDALVGSGPITLSSQAESNFQRYLDTGGPSFFVVSLDGRYSGYSYCPTGSSSGCRRDIVVFEVLGRCEKRAGQKCYIYAEEEFVVWQKDKPGPTGTRVTKPQVRGFSAVEKLSDLQLCKNAVGDTDPLGWDTHRIMVEHVEVAKARGLTPEDCAEIIEKSLG